MDPAKAAFLFGGDDRGVDADDVEGRAAILHQEFPGPDEVVSRPVLDSLTEVVCAQILKGEPPEVWATARRLLDLGMDRQKVMSQLRIVLLSSMNEALEGSAPVDVNRYSDSLRYLPLPSRQDVEGAFSAVVNESQPVRIDDLKTRAMADVGWDISGPVAHKLADMASDYITGPEGTLTVLAGGQVVDPVSLCAGAVLTHEIDVTELDLGIVDLDVDLAGYRRSAPALPASDGPPRELVSLEEGRTAWAGPHGWLDAFDAGDLVAVRVVEGELRLEKLDDKPSLDEHLVEALRAAYYRQADEADLPVPVEKILLEVLASDPDAFRHPQAPLRDLLGAAGLKINSGRAAHAPAVFANAIRTARTTRIAATIQGKDDVRAVVDLLS
ncbi:MAG: hypothetical protein ACRDZ5_12020, partial [Acidimicrobiales bacterium]